MRAVQVLVKKALEQLLETVDKDNQNVKEGRKKAIESLKKVNEKYKDVKGYIAFPTDTVDKDKP